MMCENIKLGGSAARRSRLFTPADSPEWKKVKHKRDQSER
jgi:hypothetical protein